MSEISLTASMRSNLLSLQQISKLQDSTQLRLSTGLKVNSAIDNPSSYYTASSLNNRAEDLSALLDSMGQSVQTIKAATEGIEKAEDLLELAKATATDISEKLSSENIFAIVSTKSELLNAVDKWESGNGLIVLAEDINMGSTKLELKDNQKLVGLNYIDGSQKRAELSWTFAAGSADGRGMITAEDNLLSDIKITYNSDNIDSANKSFNAIYNDGHKLNLHNVDLTVNHTATGVTGQIISGIENVNRGSIHMSGNVTLNSTSPNIANRRLINHQDKACQLVLEEGSHLDIKTQGSGTRVINSGSNVFLGDVVDNSLGGNTESFINGTFSFYQKFSFKQIATTSTALFYNSDVSFYGQTAIEISGHNHKIFSGGTSNIYGQFIVSETGAIDTNSNQLLLNHTINIHSGAEVWLNQSAGSNFISNRTENQINISAGAKFGVKKDNSGIDKLYQADKDTNITTSSAEQVDDFVGVDGLSVTGTFPQSAYDAAMADLTAEIAKIGTRSHESTLNDKDKISNYQTSLTQGQKYTDIIKQYDDLIKDSAYKGVNLLQGDDLKVIFNENRSSTVDVLGQDIRSDEIGLITTDWKSLADIKQSFDELTNAKNTLRSASTKLGNYYSIITERETFTDNLINVLQEGADKLTLADMNEESANMLSLQTQQQLAINSLSLASQSSQSILRLF